MKILIRDKDLLAALPAANVHRYLKSRGWQDKGHWGGQKLGALYLKEVGGHEWGFGFPYTDTVPDYVSCMAYAIETLGKVQGNRTITVIPAKAGIQRPNSLTPFPIRSPIPSWTPAFAGVTGV